MNSKVSIIINNYNYGRYLRDSIESAIHQTHPDTETIVVDDGSSDQSHSIIAEYHDRIIPIIKENGGQASCFNAGFEKCTGDVVIFLDADDYLSVEAAKKAIEAFDDDTIAKVHWPLRNVDKENKPTGKTVPDDKLSEGDLKEQLIAHGPSKCGGPPNSPPTSGNAWSRKILEKVLPISEQPFRFGADSYLFLLTPLFGKIKSVKQSLGYYRVHGDNNTLKPNYLTAFISRYEQFCETLSNFLITQGIHVDPSLWPRDHWYHKVYQDMNTIANVIPAEEPFILVDENHWLSGDTLMGRRRIYFTEKNGQYYGPPTDDATAIHELETDRQQGASSIVLTWPTFWWLDHYKGLHDHLQTNYRCVLQNDRLVIYSLKGS